MLSIDATHCGVVYDLGAKGIIRSNGREPRPPVYGRLRIVLLGSGAVALYHPAFGRDGEEGYRVISKEALRKTPPKTGIRFVDFPGTYDG